MFFPRAQFESASEFLVQEISLNIRARRACMFAQISGAVYLDCLSPKGIHKIFQVVCGYRCAGILAHR